MKKVLKCATLHGGYPVLLSVEYRFVIFGITIPIVFIETRQVARSLTSRELEHAVNSILN